jgi:SAM-dependent methyltransferase
MLKNIFPFYKNQMSNWNFFLTKENKKISYTPGLTNWHSVKEFGVKNIIKYLLDNFKKKELLKYSILDVGCNDGYFTERLARLKFKKTIGAEPRQEVILKGKKIRDFYKIETLASYKKLSIDQLARFKSFFDITVCSGVLHHTDNYFSNLKKILSVTKKILILEGEFIPEKLIKNKVFLKQAQLKDLIYHRKENKNLYGITIEKLETPYNDGSTIKSGLVQIVSISSIKVYAKILGYDVLIYRKKSFGGNLKTFRAIIILSKSKKKMINKNLMIDENLQNEIFFLKTALPFNLIKNANTKTKNKKFKKILELIKIAPHDKTLLEKAKYELFYKNNKKIAYSLLLNILNKRDIAHRNIDKSESDWFSQYRALYLLYVLDIKNRKKAKFWKDLLIQSNFYFPRQLFDLKIIKKNFKVF